MDDPEKQGNPWSGKRTVKRVEENGVLGLEGGR